MLLGQERPWPVGHPSSPIYPQKLPAPTREPLFRGIQAGWTLPGCASRRRKHPCSLRGPSSIGRDANPATAPCPGHVCPVFIQQLNRTKLETLHKHLETRLKITVHHPRTYKTSRGLILPREIYYPLTNIKDLEKKKDRSKDEEV